MEWITVVVGIALGVAVGGGLFAALRRPPDADSAEVGQARLAAQLELQTAEMRRLADAARAGDGITSQLAVQLADARASLAGIQAREDQRRDTELETLEVIRRLSGVLSGGGSKGRAGENLLREQLSALPPTMLVTDQRINGKVVEFALLLPDGRRLPVDSKWSGDLEMQALDAANDGTQRDAAIRAVEQVVARRAKEVATYLDPSITAGLAIAAVPDAVYDVLRKAHADALAHNVVIVPYTWALPVVLFIQSLVGRHAGEGDIQACVSEIDAIVGVMEATIENKLAKAATMLQNGNDELRAQVGKARGSVARARSGPAPSGVVSVAALLDHERPEMVLPPLHLAR